MTVCRIAAPRGRHGLAVLRASWRFVRHRRASASFVAALGMSLAFIPTLAPRSPARPEEGGLASGIVNTSYQVGSAIGLAAMTAIAAAYGADRIGDPVALTDGFSAAFLGAAVVALIVPLPQRCFSGARRRSRFRATPTALQWSEPCDRGPDHEEPDVDIGFLGMGTNGQADGAQSRPGRLRRDGVESKSGKAADVVDYGRPRRPILPMCFTSPSCSVHWPTTAPSPSRCCRRRRCRPRNRVPCMSIWPRSAGKVR